MSKKNGNPRKRRRRYGRVFKRPKGRGWLVQFVDPSGRRTAGGRRAYKTKSVASEKEGKALLKEIEKAILLGRLAPAPKTEPCDLTLLQAIDEFLDAKRAEGRSESGIRRYRTSRRALVASRLAGLRVADLQPRDIEQYMGWRRKRRWIGVRKLGAKRTDPNVIVQCKGETVSNSTVNRDVALISAALERLVRLGQLDKIPVQRVKRGKEPTRKRVVLSKDECARLLDACDPHLRTLSLAAVLTGARPCELKALRWGDVNFGNETINVFRSKVGVADAIPMHPHLASELKALKRRRVVHDDEHVFLSSKGRPNWEYRWAWRKALKRAGLNRRKGLTFYSWRHTFATHFLEHGAPSDLQQILGHASYATTERYVRAVSDRARTGIEALTLVNASGDHGRDQPKNHVGPRSAHRAEVRGV